MSDEGPVSREAFERLQDKLAEAEKRAEAAEAQVGQLTPVVQDIRRRELVQDWLAEQQVDDPRRWAALALPHVRETDDDQLEAALEDLLPDVDRLRAPGPAPGEVTPADGEPDEAPPNTDTPSFTAQPNPGADGSPPPYERIAAGSPELAELAEKGGGAAVKEAVRSGHVRLDREVRQRLEERGGP